MTGGVRRLLLLLIIAACTAQQQHLIDRFRAPCRQPGDDTVGGCGDARSGLPDYRNPDHSLRLLKGPILYSFNGSLAVVCLVPKAGSEVFRELLEQASKASHTKTPLALNTAHFTWDHVVSAARAYSRFEGLYMNLNIGDDKQREIERLMSLPGVPRFMIVRNPYTRMLSAFLDKYVNAGGNGAQGAWQRHRSNMLDLDIKPDTSFSDFVDIVYDSWLANGKRFIGRQRNKHFDPQSSQCNLEQGFQYTYFLKLEDQDLWFLDFVGMLNLTQFAREGWEEWHGRNARSLFARSPCFYAPSGVPCEDYYEGAWHGHQDSAVMNLLYSTPHSTRSSEKLNIFYTERSAQQVTEMYREDFLLFGYPYWSPKKLH